LRQVVTDITPVSAELPTTHSDLADGTTKLGHRSVAHETKLLSAEGETEK